MNGPMWSAFRQKGGPTEWSRVERGCVLIGSPIKLSVTVGEGKGPVDVICRGSDILSGNLSGYWERCPEDAATLSRSMIMDGANPSRLYRLDKCRLPLFSQVGLVDKISRARISSIHVFGDSLAKEVRFNSRQFLMQKVHVDAHEKEF